MKLIEKHGWILVFLGAVCWSLNSPLVKYMTVSAMTICCLRALIAGLVLLPFLRPSCLRLNRWMAIYLLSFAGVCITVIASLSMTDAAIAVGMQYTALIWLTRAPNPPFQRAALGSGGTDSFRACFVHEFRQRRLSFRQSDRCL